MLTIMLVEVVGEVVDMVGEVADMVREVMDMVGEVTDMAGEVIEMVGEVMDLVGTGSDIEPKLTRLMHLLSFASLSYLIWPVGLLHHNTIKVIEDTSYI